MFTDKYGNISSQGRFHRYIYTQWPHYTPVQFNSSAINSTFIKLQMFTFIDSVRGEVITFNVSFVDETSQIINIQLNSLFFDSVNKN